MEPGLSGRSSRLFPIPYSLGQVELKRLIELEMEGSVR